jgi:hypothetical protein
MEGSGGTGGISGRRGGASLVETGLKLVVVEKEEEASRRRLPRDFVLSLLKAFLILPIAEGSSESELQCDLGSSAGSLLGVSESALSLTVTRAGPLSRISTVN